jgi:CheY-like chemotaxis protein
MMAGNNDIVLIVEDEEQARAFLTQILEFEGFKVFGFANGAEALAYLEKSAQPCLIVLDLSMPIMNGPQFRAAMIRDSRLKTIPVVVVTALDPGAAAGLSPVKVFTKPIDADDLLATIRQYC